LGQLDFVVLYCGIADQIRNGLLEASHTFSSLRLAYTRGLSAQCCSFLNLSLGKPRARAPPLCTGLSNRFMQEEPKAP
jgi:hypothetical protein